MEQIAKVWAKEIRNRIETEKHIVILDGAGGAFPITRHPQGSEDFNNNEDIAWMIEALRHRVGEDWPELKYHITHIVEIVERGKID